MELEIERYTNIILEKYKVHQVKAYFHIWNINLHALYQMNTTHKTLFCSLVEYIKDKAVGLRVTKCSSLLPADCICFFKDKITMPKHLSADKCTFYKCTENSLKVSQQLWGLLYSHALCICVLAPYLIMKLINLKKVHYDDMYETLSVNRLIHRWLVWFIWHHFVWQLTPVQILTDKSTLKNLHINIYWINCWLTVCGCFLLLPTMLFSYLLSAWDQGLTWCSCA